MLQFPPKKKKLMLQFKSIIVKRLFWGATQYILEGPTNVLAHSYSSIDKSSLHFSFSFSF